MRRLSSAFLGLVLLVLLAVVPAEGNQMRSMTSRVRSDMRSLATAIESYRVDFGVYPPADAGERVPHRLTTPTAHITGLSLDWHQAYRMSPDNYASYLMRLRIPLVRLPYWVLLLTGFLLAMVMLWKARGTELDDGRRGWAARALWLLGVLVLAPYVFIGMDYRAVMPRALPAGTDTRYYYHTDGDAGWVLQSVGPDGDRDLGSLAEEDWPFGDYDAMARRVREPDSCYDPTNGAESSGDMFRAGP